jgi:F-type H+-transporting ATPase subunit delta
VNESERQIIREVYSEVLFELADQAGCVDSVTEDLACVREVIKAEPEFAAILTSPGIKPGEKAQIIRRVFQGKLENLTLDFMCVLAKRNRIGFLGPVSDKYEMLVDVHRGRALVEITWAKEPDDKQIQTLKADLKNAINKEVKLSLIVEPEIIGGIIIKRDDVLIDNSVKTALQRAVTTVINNLEEGIHEF